MNSKTAYHIKTIRFSYHRKQMIHVKIFHPRKGIRITVHKGEKLRSNSLEYIIFNIYLRVNINISMLVYKLSAFSLVIIEVITHIHKWTNIYIYNIMYIKYVGEYIFFFSFSLVCRIYDGNKATCVCGSKHE